MDTLAESRLGDIQGGSRFCYIFLLYNRIEPLYDELAGLLLVWVSFMGVTLVHYSDAGHPAVTFIIEKFPEAAQEIVGCVLNIAMAAGFLVISFLRGRTEIEKESIRWKGENER